ncbi:TetR/AcrR family transcriptional regulator [Agromyces archimandritae]|uniref:TetR family transcriptional regulator n=1 Tax=Agromyces archimandritae TaxID=2781962 RepID=A0A975IPB0_9MICO|nr:TetR/AcrR family transcriptional regulator [Agromyces archimandritae]QTX03801.1 TetR family transcriptional regulator [Agromyces archimandritae]
MERARVDAGDAPEVRGAAASAPDAAKPAPTKSARTRERILDAAAHVLSRKGYAGTRLADVAAHAGVQAPAIYYHFASRDELIEEVMWVGAARVHAHVVAELDALPTEATPLERILKAVEEHLRYELAISDYTTASIRNANQVPEELRAKSAAEEAAYARLWRDLLIAAQEAGQLRADLDVTVSRFLLLGAMNWAAEWWNPRHRTLEDLVAATQELVRHGLGAPPPVE